MKSMVPLLVLIFFITGCVNNLDKNENHRSWRQKNGHMLMGVAYSQDAAEYRALFYQAYQLAKYRLDEKLEKKNGNHKPAIITDIDETVLDNSPYEARMITEGIVYPAGWNEWCKQATARPLPGAVDFFKYAAGKGVEIFYISNRSEELKDVTIKNLRNAGFPMADSMHCLLKEKTSSKEARRQKVKSRFDVLLAIGDNLNDFSENFEKKDINTRFKVTDDLRDQFGNDFIVLPNPMYGDWEYAIYNYNYDLKAKGKRKALRNHFRTE